MGEVTKISWTTHTWNPWQGCRKVSPGCKNCYAEALVEKRMGRKFSEIRRSSPMTFNAPLKWEADLLKRPDLPIGKSFVFACSISDFFIGEADAWRDEAWEIIRRTPHLTYQILTKRPERIAEHLPKTCFTCGEPWDMHDPMISEGIASTFPCVNGGSLKMWPGRNVWLGTSIENQKYAEIRIPQLVAVPAVVHFLSCEPLLGPIDFDRCSNVNADSTKICDPHLHLDDIEWVIVGGESGPNFRTMDLDWARSIRDQCKAAGVPFFYKQGNGIRSEMNTLLDGREWREMPSV